MRLRSLLRSISIGLLLLLSAACADPEAYPTPLLNASEPAGTLPPGTPAAGFPGDPICPAGAAIQEHYPQRGAQYRSITGQPALDFFDAQIFSKLTGQVCWQSGGNQFIFRSNIDGFARAFEFDDGLVNPQGEITVQSAGCLSTSGDPGTFFAAAVVTMMSDSLEMLAVALDGSQMFYIRPSTDGPAVNVMTLTPNSSACH